MYSGKCPGEVELEEYFYGQLPPIKTKLLEYHMKRCSNCQERLDEIRRFHQVLSNIPLEEAPSELCSRIVESIRMSDAYMPLDAEPGHQAEADAVYPKAGPGSHRVFGIPAFSLKIRWAASAVLILVSVVFQWRFGGYFKPANQGSYILGWGDLKHFIELLQSGALVNTFKQVLTAFRTDGFSALEILGIALPTQVLSVVVFSGIAAVVFITHLWFSRSGGKRA